MSIGCSESMIHPLVGSSRRSQSLWVMYHQGKPGRPHMSHAYNYLWDKLWVGIKHTSNILRTSIRHGGNQTSPQIKQTRDTLFSTGGTLHEQSGPRYMTAVIEDAPSCSCVSSSLFFSTGSEICNSPGEKAPIQKGHDFERTLQ